MRAVMRRYQTDTAVATELHLASLTDLLGRRPRNDLYFVQETFHQWQ